MDKRRNARVSFAGLMAITSLVFLCQSCYYDVEEDLYPGSPCDTVGMSYSTDIQPIMDANCSACHSGTNPDAGLDLTTYQGVKGSVDNGTLLDRINRPSGDPGLMPPAGKLNDCTILKVQAWVDNGAPNN